MGTGPNDQGLSRKHVVEAVEASLRRLQTDYIDLYQTHSFDPDVPIDETLRALDDLVRAGKVRYVGASNYPAWRLMESLWSADKNNTVRYDSLQPKYNLVTRQEFEQELKPVCEKFGVGVIPYSPLAAGFLTGKYQRDTTTDSKRAEGVKNQFATEIGWRALEAVQVVAKELDSTPTAVSLAWRLHQPVISSPIIGANTPEQLQGSLGAVDLKLSDAQFDQLSRASAWK